MLQHRFLLPAFYRNHTVGILVETWTAQTDRTDQHGDFLYHLQFWFPPGAFSACRGFLVLLSPHPPCWRRPARCCPALTVRLSRWRRLLLAKYGVGDESEAELDRHTASCENLRSPADRPGVVDRTTLLTINTPSEPRHHWLMRPGEHLTVGDPPSGLLSSRLRYQSD